MKELPRQLQCSVPGGTPFGTFADVEGGLMTEHQRNYQRRELLIDKHPPSFWDSPIEVPGVCHALLSF